MREGSKDTPRPPKAVDFKPTTDFRDYRASKEKNLKKVAPTGVVFTAQWLGLEGCVGDKEGYKAICGLVDDHLGPDIVKRFSSAEYVAVAEEVALFQILQVIERLPEDDIELLKTVGVPAAKLACELALQAGIIPEGEREKPFDQISLFEEYKTPESFMARLKKRLGVKLWEVDRFASEKTGVDANELVEVSLVRWAFIEIGRWLSQAPGENIRMRLSLLFNRRESSEIGKLLQSFSDDIGQMVKVVQEEADMILREIDKPKNEETRRRLSPASQKVAARFAKQLHHEFLTSITSFNGNLAAGNYPEAGRAALRSYLFWENAVVVADFFEELEGYDEGKGDLQDFSETGFDELVSMVCNKASLQQISKDSFERVAERVCGVFKQISPDKFEIAAKFSPQDEGGCQISEELCLAHAIYGLMLNADMCRPQRFARPIKVRVEKLKGKPRTLKIVNEMFRAKDVTLQDDLNQAIGKSLFDIGKVFRGRALGKDTMRMGMTFVGGMTDEYLPQGVGVGLFAATVQLRKIGMQVRHEISEEDRKIITIIEPRE